MFSAADHAHMARALQLAALGLATTTPNPRVGCVIVRGEEVVGEGWHRRAGEAHAEVHALRMAGARARGATAYVSLEPCNHHGRTPPCSEALIEAGLARVVAAMEDPNPRVAGQGLARLAAAGVTTECGLLTQEAQELNIGFVSRMSRGRPWLRLKVAASVDGKTALANGVSQWITSAPARRDAHAWRARSCAVLTGIGTVKDDDPQLSVRDVPCERQPLRVIVDSRLETPPQARVFAGATVLIACATDDPLRSGPLRDRGADIVVLPNAQGKVDLPKLMQELGRRGINEVLTEAGFKLNGSLLREGCVDELLIYLAPSLIGDAARGMFDLPALASLEQKQRLEWREVRQVGADLRLVARFAPA